MMYDGLKSLYILDGYFWIFRSFYAPIGMDMVSPTGEPTSATYMFVVSLLKLIREQKPDAVVVAMEGKSKTFRDELYPEYKHNREQPPEDFTLQRDRIEQILGAMHIPVLRAKGYEADDIIGTLAKRAYTTEYEAIICSNDKDMYQLLNECTCMFNVSTCKYMYTDGMVEKTGVQPHEFRDYLALQGDGGDNVPGLPNVGPKTAAKWIQKYGNIDNLLEHVDEIKGRHNTTLKENKELLLLCRKLVTIECDVPIHTDFSSFDLQEYDYDKLLEIFNELGFNKLILDMGLD
jgi:DNA polymerase-1